MQIAAIYSATEENQVYIVEWSDALKRGRVMRYDGHGAFVLTMFDCDTNPKDIILKDNKNVEITFFRSSTND